MSVARKRLHQHCKKLTPLQDRIGTTGITKFCHYKKNWHLVTGQGWFEVGSNNCFEQSHKNILVNSDTMHFNSVGTFLLGKKLYAILQNQVLNI
jgi:hypothetical protein